MIDYLEDLLEEETNLELTGRPLVPVERQTAPLWEEDEASLRERPVLGKNPGGGMVPAEEGGERLEMAGRASWREEAAPPRSGAVRLLELLTQRTYAAGAIRQQAPLTVTLAGEHPRAVGLDLEAMDRAVQRDARRYDGGFPLY